MSNLTESGHRVPLHLEHVAALQVLDQESAPGGEAALGQVGARRRLTGHLRRSWLAPPRCTP
jgi:hypothetical protein